MNKKTVTSAKNPTHVEIKYWSPKGIPFTDEDRLVVLNMIRIMRGETQKIRKYTSEVQNVTFDLVFSGCENDDRVKNFNNIAKVCSHIVDDNTLHILCLREPFPVQALSALHDVYICSGAPYDVRLSNAPEGMVIGVNTVMMPVYHPDGRLCRWTSIY